jgi:hypothetical protein
VISYRPKFRDEACIGNRVIRHAPDESRVISAFPFMSYIITAKATGA